MDTQAIGNTTALHAEIMPPVARGGVEREISSPEREAAIRLLESAALVLLTPLNIAGCSRQKPVPVETLETETKPAKKRKELPDTVDELLALRETVKTGSPSTWFLQDWVPRKPESDWDYGKIREEVMKEIDEKIKEKDPGYSPKDLNIWWKPWTWGTTKRVVHFLLTEVV